MIWLKGLALVVAFAIAAAVMFPLRMAWCAITPPAGLSVAGVSGTIWSGRLTGVAWRGIPLGDFDVAMSALDLLPAPALRLAEGSGPLKSAVLRSAGDELEMTDATVSVRLADLSAAAPADLTARITGGALFLRGGRCTHAAGQVASPAAASLGLPAFSGTLACDKGAVLADLNSNGGKVLLEISPGLDRVSYRSAPPMLEVALAAIGIPVADSQP